ncbi:unnamed protein product [Lactuca saligna]|uniref:Uncharacterized protein n=1 Tax=Lactuca saligna TaxID=75948 RepID=A0AA35VR83_LACSI|nr:unnamed protein product [Lactuca saligna]
MARSSKTALFADQSASFIMLNMNPNWNLTIDLDSPCYSEALGLMIVCLKFLPLAQALTMADSIPLVHLSKAYSFAMYNNVYDIIHLKVASHKTSITRPHFIKI